MPFSSGSLRCNDAAATKLARIRLAIILISPSNSDSLLGNIGERAALYLLDGVLVQIDKFKRRQTFKAVHGEIFDRVFRHLEPAKISETAKRAAEASNAIVLKI